MAESKQKTAQDVYNDAQQLSADERELLMIMLEQNQNRGWASPEIEQAWLEEARRRSTLRAAGSTSSIPGEEFIADLRRKYAG